MPSISNPIEHLEGTGEVTGSLVGSVSKHLEQAAVETADMWYDEFDRCTELLDELLEARTLDRVVEIEADYLQCCQRALSRQSSRLRDLCLALGEDMMKPIAGEYLQKASSGQQLQNRSDGENEPRPRPRARRKDGSGLRPSHRPRPPLPPYIPAEP